MLIYFTCHKCSTGVFFKGHCAQYSMVFVVSNEGLKSEDIFGSVSYFL